MKKFKRCGCVLSAVFLCVALFGCSALKPVKVFRAGMVVTNSAGKPDNFTQSAKAGLNAFAKSAKGIAVTETEAEPDDAAQKLQSLVPGGYSLIWGVGGNVTAAVNAAAAQKPAELFAALDETQADAPAGNVVKVVFRIQESAFLAGYIAAQKTKSGQLGLVGGVKGPESDPVRFGFEAGAAYGAKQLGKKVTVNEGYTYDENDSVLAGGIARSLYESGCDIVFSAASGLTQGIAGQAKSRGALCIGVGSDQSSLAPANVVTSAVELPNQAVAYVSQKVRAGERLGGKTLSLGLAEGCVGVPVSAQAQKLCGAALLGKVETVRKQIVGGTIKPPVNAAQFEAFTGVSASDGVSQ